MKSTNYSYAAISICLVNTFVKCFIVRAHKCYCSFGEMNFHNNFNNADEKCYIVDEHFFFGCVPIFFAFLFYIHTAHTIVYTCPNNVFLYRLPWFSHTVAFSCLFTTFVPLFSKKCFFTINLCISCGTLGISDFFRHCRFFKCTCSYPYAKTVSSESQ